MKPFMRRIEASKCGNVELFFLYALFASLGLMSFVPDFTQPSTYLFIIFYFCMLLLWVVKVGRFLKVDRMGLIILFFLLYLACVGVPLAMLQGRELPDALRALTPFVFLITYLYFHDLASRNRVLVLRLILVSSVVWMLKVYLLSYQDVISFFSGSLGRLTYASSDLLVPFALVGFCVSLYVEPLRAPVRLLLLGAFLMLIIASGYRAQILIAMAVVLIYLKFWKSALGVFAGVVLFLVSLYVVFYTGVFDVLVQRMQGSAGDSVRAQEWSFAWTNFLSSPVWGNGLGTPVSVEYTRGGLGSSIEKEASEASRGSCCFAVFFDAFLYGLGLFSANTDDGGVFCGLEHS